MPKINVYLPDELAEAVKETGVPVSAICQRALEQAVRRVSSIRTVVQSDLGAPGAGDPAPRLSRFTRRAGEAVRLGVQRARKRGSGLVETADLLSGLLLEGGNLAVQLLPSMEVEPDELRHRLDALPPRSDGEASGETGGSEDAGNAGETAAPPQEARFSPETAAALELAAHEALSLGHNFVGGEHVLLGLIAEPDGAAGRILRELGAELRLTRRTTSAAIAGYAYQQAQAAARSSADPAAGAAADSVRQLLARLDRLEQRLDEHLGGAPNAQG
ncbi:Clp protease N-terminal domain-containing protein [Phaeacidiphilus oryzae]|uniref:Clp protease N-terminal domain-containing protein n=1 Tax=Phaeacidiphilus oryzae TaxID=348818 RepID=UPI00055F9291|nr:Clp protease N-terminal domain-containing protein [Phaeacidiphilus oryzae]